jgi:small GTP-binding protein
MKTLIINSNEIKLQIWDTAGMEKYKQITTSYYRGAQGAIVVFDLSSHSSFESVQQWIDEFCQITCTEANTGDKMIILVDNKSDFVLKRQVTQEEIEMFVETNKIAYDETSVLNGDGNNDMFETFANALMRKYIGKSLGIKESKPKRINFQLGIGHKVIFIKQQW